jgi:hypothetical protein
LHGTLAPKSSAVFGLVIQIRAKPLAASRVKSVPERLIRLHGFPLEEAAAPEQLRLLREAAARQEADAARISVAIFQALQAEIPTYGAIHDPELIRDVQAASAALVTIWLRAIKSGEIEESDLLPIRHSARRRVRQGVALTSLLKAYRVAVRVMWRELLQSPEWQQPELAPLLAVVAEWALDFSDAISTEVDTSYLDEQRKLAEEQEHRRSALLELVLAGRLEEARLDLMPELRTPHVVVVAEVVEDPPMEKLDRVGEALEKHAGVKLWTVRQKAVVGVVRRTPGEARQRVIHLLQEVMSSEPIVLRLGLGGDSQGPETTPSSYSEANDAIRIGKAMFGSAQRVHDFNSLGQYGLALREPAIAARWAASQLAEFGPALKRRWSLPTLESYLAHRGNHKAVARELGVHVNTVKYRLSIIRSKIGTQMDDGESAGELLMAIRLNRIMNPRAG